MCLHAYVMESCLRNIWIWLLTARELYLVWLLALPHTWRKILQSYKQILLLISQEGKIRFICFTGKVGQTTSALELWWMLVLVERSSDRPEKLGKRTTLIWNVDVSPLPTFLSSKMPFLLSTNSQDTSSEIPSLLFALGQLQNQVEASSSVQPTVLRANTISHWVHQSYFLSSFSYFASFFLSLLTWTHIVVYHLIPLSALWRYPLVWMNTVAHCTPHCWDKNQRPEKPSFVVDQVVEKILSPLGSVSDFIFAAQPRNSKRQESICNLQVLVVPESGWKCFASCKNTMSPCGKGHFSVKPLNVALRFHWRRR